MTKNQAFFASQEGNSMNEYLGFDNDMYADNWSGDGQWSNADADVYASGASEAPTSTPFKLTLTNTTAVAVTDVAFLDAANAIISGAAGNYGIKTPIAVTYDIAGISYGSFMYSLLTQPVEIGETYIESNQTAQLTKSLKIETYNVRGAGKYETFSPTINPVNNQTLVIVMPYKFTLNQFTKMTYSVILGSASVTFSMYPKKETSSLQGLGAQTKVFSNPNISGMKLIQK